jgi:hypothetical protein
MTDHGIGTCGDQLVALLDGDGATEQLQLLADGCSRAQTTNRRPATVRAAPSQNGQ